MLQSYLLDVLLTATERGLCHVRWSAESLAELEEHYVLIRARRGSVTEEVARSQITRKIEAMTTAFPEALISDLGDLNNLELKDPDDRHVLAAAIKSHADCIVTHNLRDFTRSTLAHYGIGLESPDEFLQSIIRSSPEVLAGMIRVLLYVSEKTSRPHVPLDELLERLAKSAPNFIKNMRVTLNLHAAQSD